MAVVSSISFGRSGNKAGPPGATFKVAEDVWVDGALPGNRQRIYRRGDVITEAEAVRLGLKKEPAVADKKAPAPANKKRTRPESKE